MLKEPIKVSSPANVGHNLVRNEDEQRDYEYFIGVLHVAAPFLIGMFSFRVAIVYFLCVFVLYSTFFRHKSQGFFASVALVTVGFLMYLTSISAS